MAREVIFKTWCDLCLVEEEQVDGIELPAMALPELPGKPRTIALCEVHRKEFYDPLVELLREYGAHVDESGVPTGPRGKYKPRATTKVTATAGTGLTCPDCQKVVPDRSGLSSHGRQQHQKTLAVLLGEVALEDAHQCPECHVWFAEAKGLGAHRSKAHGVPGAAKSTVAAKNRSTATKKATKKSAAKEPELELGS